MEGHPRRVHYPDEEEFDLAFRRLNALCDESEKWQRKTARKTHEDVHGVRIENSEVYYMKSKSRSPRELCCMSRESMEKLLFLTVPDGGRAAELGDLMIKKELEQLRDPGGSLVRR